jgi:hypothetical protein
MWSKRRRTRPKFGITPLRWVAAPATAVIMVALAGGLTVTPSRDIRVGDIITFTPDPSLWSSPGGGAERISVHRPGSFGCVLDLGVLRYLGGSLVAEAQFANEGHSFRLHWAGERTAADASDCGASADLIIDQSTLRQLARAASAGSGASALGPMQIRL